MRRLLLSSAIACCVFSFAAPTHAAGNYYVFAGNSDASDSNSCQVAADPCATLEGVIGKIEDNIDPSNATVYAEGTFTENVYINDQNLDGLTLTAYDTSDRPVIDAGENDNGIVVSGVLSNITIEHFDITNAAATGVAVYGSSDTHADTIVLSDLFIHDFVDRESNQYGIQLNSADNTTIKNVLIDSLGSTTLSNVNIYGISVNNCDHLTIKNSTIRNLTASVDMTSDTFYYGSISGMYIQGANDLKIVDNSISDLSAVVTATSASTSYASLFGINMGSITDAVIRGNTLQDFNLDITENSAGSNGYADVYGISGTGQERTVVRGNVVKDFSNTFTTLDSSYGNPTIYGISLSGVEENVVRGNTVKALLAFANNPNSDSNLYGIKVNGIAKTDIYNNVIRNTTARGLEQGGTNNGIYVVDAPKSNIYHNRIANFVAEGSDQTVSTGIQLGYNSEVDVFNNAIYFTDEIDQTEVNGIVLLSGQSSPTRIYHNTLARMLKCLSIDNMGETYFMNNVCYMVDGGAYGIEVTSGDTDLTQLHSNNNSFYNAIGVLSFNDTTEGILGLSDWQSGIYAQDADSSSENPRLNLAHPKGDQYLHLKANSPLIGVGVQDLTFGNDDAMTALLQKDWDGEKRFSNSHPDVGFDQYHS